MDVVGEIYEVPKELRWGTGAKIAKLDEYQKQSGLEDRDFCYVGDEMIDLGVMSRVGFPVAPSDGAPEAKNVAAHITKAGGGQGVVRELAEFILKAQGKWEDVIQKISNPGAS
jgi:3-deoxy-D-manno-octulosonate 8-phosphate phosphatase (KDO 8-P phosphatase)